MNSVKLYAITALLNCHVTGRVMKGAFMRMSCTTCSRKICAASRNANVLLKYFS